MSRIITRQDPKERANILKERRMRANPMLRRYKNWKSAGIDMTPARYEAMFAAQNGGCAICGRPQSEFTRRLAVDHNHVSGKTRGLLCTTCNSTVVVAVERFAGLLAKAQQYLLKYEKGAL